MLLALERDLRDPGVGLGSSFGESIAKPGDCQHPATGGDYGTFHFLGSRMEHLHVLQRPDPLQPVDDVSLGGRGRIASRRHDHPHRRSWPPARGRWQFAAGRGCPQQLQQVAFQPRQQRLSLRIAEAAIELEHFGPVLGQHDPRVEHAPEVDAAPLDLGHRGPDHHLDQPFVESGIDGRHRRVRAHAAGVGAGVAVEHPLVVLGRRERKDLVTAHYGEKRHLLPFEELLDENGIRRPAEAPLQEAFGQRSLGLLQLVGHDDTFAGSQPVRLHHHRRSVLPEVGESCAVLGEGGRATGRNTGGVHHLLGERFRALEKGAVRARPEHGEALLPQLVGKAGDERSFGPDHGQVDPLPLDESHEAWDVVGLDVDDEGVVADAGVSRRAEEPPDSRAPPQAADQGVLAGASADHQNIQLPVRSHGLTSLY